MTLGEGVLRACFLEVVFALIRAETANVDLCAPVTALGCLYRKSAGSVDMHTLPRRLFSFGSFSPLFMDITS